MEFRGPHRNVLGVSLECEVYETIDKELRKAETITLILILAFDRDIV